MAKDASPSQHPLIRPATIADRAEWLRMRHALWPDDALQDLSDDMDVWLKQQQCMPLVAERPAGGLCGFLETAIRPCDANGLPGRFGYLEGWYVDPDVRRTGVGRKLAQAAEMWCLEQACCAILSDAHADNFLSHDAHRGVGFELVGTRLHFRKPMNSSAPRRQTYSTCTPWEKQVAYSRAVRVGQFVFVSGTTASDQAGQTIARDDPYGQAIFILRKIEAALHHVGAQLSDVVRTRMFVTDISRWEEIGRAHGEVFVGINPAATMVEVKRLINVDHLVEIEVDAVIGDVKSC